MGAPHLAATAEARSTGWRDVKDWLNPAVFTPGASATHYVRICRTGQEVSLRLRLTIVSGAPAPTSRTLFTLPAGWRYRNLYTAHGGGFVAPASPVVLDSLASAQVLTVRVLSGPAVADGVYVQGYADWATDDPWPTTLPGTPA